MRPDDLRRRRHRPRPFGVGKHDAGRALDRRAEFAPANREDAAALANLILLGAQRDRRVPLALGDVRDLARHRLERESIAVLRIGDRIGALHDVEPEVERVAAEDVSHVRAADDDHLETGFLGDRLEAGRRHLARAADGKPVTGDDEGLARMHARAEVRHQVAERPRLPSLVERLEALGDAVGRRRDLIRVDRVELLAGLLRIPEDEGFAAESGDESPDRPRRRAAGPAESSRTRRASRQPALRSETYEGS